METILHQIDMNIMRKKLMLMKKNLKEMDNETILMEYESKEITKVYDKLLYKKQPVGSSLSAVQHLKRLK
mgnify:CR=1 FL=1